MEAKIDEVEAKYSPKIYRAEQMAIGSVLVTLDDMKKFPVVKARLKTFATCVRGAHEKSFVRGKKQIKTSLN